MEKLGLDNLAIKPANVKFRKGYRYRNYLRGSNPLTRVCKGILPGW
jgi:hypothetical protein